MTDARYFEDLYAQSDDPWHLAQRPYERRKYELTMASLPHQHYRRAFEPGCSIGLLTEMLSKRCDEVVATDPFAAPLADAASRLAPRNINFAQGRIPDDWPDGTFDLILLSELLYYLSADDRGFALDAVESSLDAGGHLMAVHWRHPFDEAECTGDDVHAEIAARESLEPVVRHEETDFLLEVFRRAQA